MGFTNTSERGLERLICQALTGRPCDVDAEPPETIGERPAVYGAGWVCGNPADYDREYCVDLAQLQIFLQTTQPKVTEALGLGEGGPARRKFLSRLQGEITKGGTIDVLRHGLKHGPHHIDTFYGTPSPGNPAAAERYNQNRFSVTRQLRYSRNETQLALDLALFINGLPVATFELKNSLTKQTVEDAIQQYQRDRDPREKIFEFGRCVVHFAVDDHEVRFCTHLKGKGSWFLPFNLGWNDGAGNPPNPNGLKSDYLWKGMLTRQGLTDILENYAQIVEGKDEKSGRKKRAQIWPRFHQLDVVRRLLSDAGQHGTGRRYLIQHSAGSGKSNSIAWKPWVYWVPDDFLGIFNKFELLGAIGKPRQGLSTADRHRYVRYWWEIGLNQIGLNISSRNSAINSGKRWFPYMKGEGSLRWWGNQESVVNWYNDGKEIHECTPKSVVRNPSYYFCEGVTWGKISSKGFNARLQPKGFIFSDAGMTCYPDSKYLLTILGILNIPFCDFILSAMPFWQVCWGRCPHAHCQPS